MAAVRGMFGLPRDAAYVQPSKGCEHCYGCRVRPVRSFEAGRWGLEILLLVTVECNRQGFRS